MERRVASRRIGLLCALLGVVAFLALKPGILVAAWEGVLGLIAVKGDPVPASPAVLSEHEIVELEGLEPQVQADRLLMRAINHYEGAAELIERKVDGWRGKIVMDPALTARHTTAMNSNDLRVRAAAIEIYLAAYGIPKTEEQVELLISRSDRLVEAPKVGEVEVTAETTDARPHYLWALGLLANRGVARERVLDYLSRWLTDPDLPTRQWAVEGLAYMGGQDVVVPLLRVFHDDPSGFIRERAACGLAQSGMLTQEQRWTAVPELIRFTDDRALDAQTQGWAYQALRDITGERLVSDPGSWRGWWGSGRPVPQGRPPALALADIPPERLAPGPPPMEAPDLLSPEEGAVLEAFPRDTTLAWSPVPGANTYTVEVDCFGCCAQDQWCEDVGRTYVYAAKVAGPPYRLRFAGMTRGRWRCWGVDPEGRMGRKPEWREFRFTR